MTRQLEYSCAGTDLGKWFRSSLKDSKDGLVILDADLILYFVYEYKIKALMLVEEKSRGYTIHTAQGMTLPIITKALSLGADGAGISFWGLHILRMENTTPDNSQWMTWDGIEKDCETIKKYLNFEMKP